MPLAGAMVVGVDVHHDTENNTKSVAGYCATTDSDFTHYYSRYEKKKTNTHEKKNNKNDLI